MDKKSIREIINSLNKSDVFTSEYCKENQTTTYSYKEYEMVCHNIWIGDSYGVITKEDQPLLVSDLAMYNHQLFEWFIYTVEEIIKDDKYLDPIKDLRNYSKFMDEEGRLNEKELNIFEKTKELGVIRMPESFGEIKNVKMDLVHNRIQSKHLLFGNSETNAFWDFNNIKSEEYYKCVDTLYDMINE